MCNVNTIRIHTAKIVLDTVTKARIATKNIESHTYNFTEDDARVVEELAQEFECVCKILRKATPQRRPDALPYKSTEQTIHLPQGAKSESHPEMFLTSMKEVWPKNDSMFWQEIIVCVSYLFQRGRGHQCESYGPTTEYRRCFSSTIVKLRHNMSTFHRTQHKEVPVADEQKRVMRKHLSMSNDS